MFKIFFELFGTIWGWIISFLLVLVVCIVALRMYNDGVMHRAATSTGNKVEEVKDSFLDKLKEAAGIKKKEQSFILASPFPVYYYFVAFAIGGGIATLMAMSFYFSKFGIGSTLKLSFLDNYNSAYSHLGEQYAKSMTWSDTFFSLFLVCFVLGLYPFFDRYFFTKVKEWWTGRYHSVAFPGLVWLTAFVRLAGVCSLSFLIFFVLGRPDCLCFIRNRIRS